MIDEPEEQGEILKFIEQVCEFSKEVGERGFQAFTKARNQEGRRKSRRTKL